MFADKCRLETALRSASLSVSRARTDSPLDEEKKELLETIVEKLNVLAYKGAWPEFSQVRGAVTLLRHLSSARAEHSIRTGLRNFSLKTLKFTGPKDEMLFRSRMRPQG
jgi:hypothetical protein